MKLSELEAEVIRTFVRGELSAEPDLRYGSSVQLSFCRSVVDGVELAA